MEHQLKFLFDIQNVLQQWGLTASQAYISNMVIGILFILFLAFLSDLLTFRVILLVLTRLAGRTKTEWDNILVEKKVFNRLSHLAPALVLWHSTRFVLAGYPVLTGILQKVLTIYMIIIITMSISAFLKALHEIYRTLPVARGRSIKGYVQLAQIIIVSLAVILVISTLSGAKPTALVTGLGAMAAVLLLVFRDTILGLVAGVQLSSNDMVRIGDWITVPKYGADGTVLEISLITVKVRNFDKTITTLPTYALISDYFINWRGMEETGGRRFKKFLNINMQSVRFCDDKLLENLRRHKGLKEFIDRASVQQSAKDEPGFLLHEGEVTNLTLFRKYLVHVLKNHSGLDQKLPILVRQLQPAETGIPIEIIAFTRGTDILFFEEIQSDLFDHLLAVLPEFGLTVFQYPTGEDFQRIIPHHRAD